MLRELTWTQRNKLETMSYVVWGGGLVVLAAAGGIAAYRLYEAARQLHDAGMPWEDSVRKVSCIVYHKTRKRLSEMGKEPEPTIPAPLVRPTLRRRIRRSDFIQSDKRA